MARAAPKIAKTVSTANLERLEPARLAELLMTAAAGDPGFKRRLRLELAAEIGPAELAMELDRRLESLAASRGRISWRKRPGLLRELAGLRSLIVERLAEVDPTLALDRLVAWYDLAEPLSARVKDTKGELVALFEGAVPDLAAVARAAGVPASAGRLVEALDTRAGVWAPAIARAAPFMDPDLAQALVARLAPLAPTASARRRLVLRRLADRAGDTETWTATLTTEDRRSTTLGAEASRRLALAGQAEAARALLEGCRPVAAPARGFRRASAPPPPDEAWRVAEIAVLEAEGRTEEASEARWLRFERTLSAGALRDIVARLADFDDVVAVDRALAFARGAFDLEAALAFLFDWGALREAADAVLARADELRGVHPDTALWAARLAGRHAAAAVHLLRARARVLAEGGPDRSAELVAVLAEAEGLAAEAEGLAPHAEFVSSLRN